MLISQHDYHKMSAGDKKFKFSKQAEKRQEKTLGLAFKSSKMFMYIHLHFQSQNYQPCLVRSSVLRDCPVETKYINCKKISPKLFPLALLTIKHDIDVYFTTIHHLNPILVGIGPPTQK